MATRGEAIDDSIGKPRVNKFAISNRGIVSRHPDRMVRLLRVRKSDGGARREILSSRQRHIRVDSLPGDLCRGLRCPAIRRDFLPGNLPDAEVLRLSATWSPRVPDSLRDGKFTCFYLCCIGYELSYLVLDLISHPPENFCFLPGQSTVRTWVGDTPV